MLNSRAELKNAKRLVVKVGSSSITGANTAKIDDLVSAISASIARGTEVILVSSGAIATALPLFKLNSRPDDLASAQALAAVGQSRLIARYQTSLERFDLIAGQVLLTSGDLENEETRTNARSAIEKLLSLKVVPIVNENDTVATAEIRFGDNDRLAALVAVLVEADALILLSDVDALYNVPPSTPGAYRIESISSAEELGQIEIGGSSTTVGTGGAVTKVGAAKVANSAGIPVLLTSADNVEKALTGSDVGTWFQVRS